MEQKPKITKEELQKVANVKKVKWEDCKNLLIKEAQSSFLIVLKCFTAHICANYCFEFYYKKLLKRTPMRLIKFWVWIALNWILFIDIQPYLKKNMLHKEVKE